MSDDPPRDEIISKIDEWFSHPDPQTRMKEYIREVDERQERERLELHERLRAQRENDPNYWKGLYNNLTAKIEQDRKEEKRRRDSKLVILIFG